MKVNKKKFTYWQLRDLQDEQRNQDEATERLKIINNAYQKAQAYLSDEVQKIYRRYFYADITKDEDTKAAYDQALKRAWSEAEKQSAVYDTTKDYTLHSPHSVEVKQDKIVIKNPDTGKEVATVPMDKDVPKSKITEIPNRYVEKALETRWKGKNFSARIWGNTDKLAERLQELFTVKELSNLPEREMIKRIEQEFNVGKFYASRLIRTEANFFYSKIKLDNWRKRGVKQYQLLIDSRTSKICRSINGNIYNVKDAVFGKNVPPLHPFCRTVPVIYLGNARSANNKPVKK